MKTNLILGDCLEKLKELEDNSVDTIITDQPYGLSFMGKKWDYDVPSVEVWQECLRVLKPGGTALIFAGSRTQHRMAVNVEDAGFILKDCIMWLYGSGLPKAPIDIAKQIDKKSGITEWKETTPNPAWRKGNGKDATTSTGWAKPHRPPKPVVETPEAKLWNGWKSHGLKPAYEPILVAMKPNDGTYVNNALKYKVAGLNIDGARIPSEDKLARPYEPQGRFPANIILDSDKYGEWTRFFYVAKASTAERNAGCDELGGNNHPTVKPLKLMEYLCTLTKTPTGGIVLDPFMGSGTTGVACANTGRDFIGIEREEDYIKIAEARIKYED